MLTLNKHNQVKGKSSNPRSTPPRSIHTPYLVVGAHVAHRVPSVVLERMVVQGVGVVVVVAERSGGHRTGRVAGAEEVRQVRQVLVDADGAHEGHAALRTGKETGRVWGGLFRKRAGGEGCPNAILKAVHDFFGPTSNFVCFKQKM